MRKCNDIIWRYIPHYCSAFVSILFPPPWKRKLSLTATPFCRRFKINFEFHRKSRRIIQKTVPGRSSQDPKRRLKDDDNVPVVGRSRMTTNPSPMNIWLVLEVMILFGQCLMKVLLPWSQFVALTWALCSNFWEMPAKPLSYFFWHKPASLRDVV